MCTLPSRIHLFMIIPVIIVLVCPFVLFANLRLLMCLNVFFDHHIFLSDGLKNTLVQIAVSRSHSFFHRLPHFVKLPLLNCSLLIRCIELTFNDFVEVSIQHLVYHVSRFPFVWVESNEGNCRYVLIHSLLWYSKLS